MLQCKNTPKIIATHVTSLYHWGNATVCYSMQAKNANVAYGAKDMNQVPGQDSSGERGVLRQGNGGRWCGVLSCGVVARRAVASYCGVGSCGVVRRGVLRRGVIRR